MRLTYEQLRKLPMTYIFGLNRDDLCARKYVNEEWRICKEVVTPRKIPGDIYSGFKKPKVSFYRGNDGPIYSTSRALYEGEFLTPWFSFPDHKPVRGGWYETDLGMVAWCGTHFITHQYKQPTKWRGMRDIQPTKGTDQ